MTKLEKLNRPSVESMDGILGLPFSVLDEGFIRVIDYMGDEAAIVQAARVSYGEGTKTPSDDRGLLRYLLRKSHSSPFEMCEIKLHVKLPIFVARQWIRHRTASVNEVSARYSILPGEFYFPEVEDIEPQSKSNRQGRGGTLPMDVRHDMRNTIMNASGGADQLYGELLHGWPWFDETGEILPGYVDPDGPGPHSGEKGMARELARMVLPLNTYTEWYWKIDLHNLLHFLRLRMDPHAQKEIRKYADVIWSILKGWLPNVAQAFDDYVLGAVTFSRQEMEVLLEYLHDNSAIELGVPKADGMSLREHAEFEAKLQIHAAE